MDQTRSKTSAERATVGPAGDERAPDAAGVVRSWPTWVPYAAAVWSVGYALAALAWTFTGSGFPMGANDPEPSMSLLGGMPADVGAPMLAAVALAGAGTATVMARVRRHGGAASGWWRRFAVGFGAALATVLLVVIPDMRLLAILGYVPMIVVKAPFDGDIRDRLGEVLGTEHLHQSVALVGGFLWAAATLVYARRTAGTCERCGRGEHRRAWITPSAAARWGRFPVYVAAVIPAIYAATRWIWVAGFPMGIDEELHAEGMADGSLWSGAWLGTFALVGTVLTLGLVQRWGEVFPRWIPRWRARPVPIALAVVPASLVAAMAMSGGLSFLATAFDEDAPMALSTESWAAVGPALLWPIWGVALAGGTVAYYLRRRGACGSCGGV